MYVFATLLLFKSANYHIGKSEEKRQKYSFTIRAMAGEIAQQMRLIEEVTDHLSLILMYAYLE